MSDVEWIRNQIHSSTRRKRSTTSRTFELGERIKNLHQMLKSETSSHEATKEYIWFIENFPDSPLFLELPPISWASDCLILIKAAWDKVVIQSSSIPIFKNMIASVSYADVPWLLGMIGNDKDNAFGFELAKLYIYQYQIHRSDAERCEALAANYAIHIGEQNVPYAEEFSLLQRIIPACIECEDLDSAAELSNNLLEIADKSNMLFWKTYARIFQIRIALRQNKSFRALMLDLTNTLVSVRKLIRAPLHIGTTKNMKLLFNDLQQRNKISQLAKLLEVCIETTNGNEKRLLRKHLSQLNDYGVTKFF